MREFETGATRDDDTEKLDFEGFLSPLVLRRFAEYMHEHRKQADGKLRASDNWTKGIPREAYMKSLTRHFMDLWLGWREQENLGKVWEDLLCAILFNVQGLLYETLVGQTSTRSQIYRLDAPGDQKPLGGGRAMADSSLSPQELESYTKQTGIAFSGLGLVPREVKK